MRATTRLLVLALTTFSQLAAQSPSFSAASITAGDPNVGVHGGCHGTDSTNGFTPGECYFTNGRLSHLIMFAWRLNNIRHLKYDQDWIGVGDFRYNLEARIDDPKQATEAQLLALMQALLVERFQMKYHRETIPTPGVALVVVGSGSKLKKSASADMAFAVEGGRPVPGQPGSLEARKVTMERLSQYLSIMTGGPVIDKTGLTEAYDFKWSWNDTASPTLSSALQEQLGLRLEPQEVPVSMFIVDSAQKPAVK
jgi:uncharacterized protein (TIGR03435 family)